MINAHTNEILITICPINLTLLVLVDMYAIIFFFTTVSVRLRLIRSVYFFLIDYILNMYDNAKRVIMKKLGQIFLCVFLTRK